jgi:DNA-binding HxlR family transcriptional regulator
MTRWTPLTLHEPMADIHSFNDIQRAVPFSLAVLIGGLRDLEHHGIVEMAQAR